MSVLTVPRALKAADKLSDGERAARAAKAAQRASKAASAVQETVTLRVGEDAYVFHNMSPEEAERILWTKVTKPKAQGDEEVIDLPSELPPERQKELDDLAAAKTELEGKVSTLEATILEFKRKRDPVKLSPGIYQDEDTGKYFQIDKDGNMKELTDEAP